MKFKVGDRVRILTQRLPYTFRVGTIGIVTSTPVNTGTYNVYCDGDWWCYGGKDLKLLKKVPKPTDQIRHILSRHISNKKKMELITEVVASNQT